MAPKVGHRIPEISPAPKAVKGALLALALFLPVPVPAAIPVRHEIAVNLGYDLMRKEMTKVFRAGMKKNSVRGISLAVVDETGIIWGAGFGYTDAEKKEPATIGTIFRAGSVSKLFTMMEVMRLRDAGKLDLDAPLAKYLPRCTVRSRFPGAKPMTLRSIMAHHSGLPSDLLRGMWIEKPVSLAALEMEVAEEDLCTPPQTQYRDSNLGISLLGRMIEVVTGKPFRDAMDADILGPLGMEYSAYILDENLRPRCACGYRGGKRVRNPNLRDLPAGSLWTSVEDMAKFLKFVITDGATTPGILKRESLNEMFKEQFPGLPLDFGNRVGIGWTLSGFQAGGDDLAWHDGAALPFWSTVAVSRRHRMGIVILANSEEGGRFLMAAAAKTLEMAIEAKTGTRTPAPARPKWKEASMTKAELDALAGDYVVQRGLTEMRISGGSLRTKLQGASVKLIPVAGPGRVFVPRVALLGLFPYTLDQFRIRFDRMDDVEFAVLTGEEIPSPLAFQRIRKAALPEAWRKRVGIYRCVNPDDQVEIRKVSLEDRGGFLVAKVDLAGPHLMRPMEISAPFSPVSDDEARGVGLGIGEGAVLRGTVHKGAPCLRYSGYLFVLASAPRP